MEPSPKNNRTSCQQDPMKLEVLECFVTADCPFSHMQIYKQRNVDLQYSA